MLRPAADVELAEADALRIVRAAFPELDARRVRALDSGWDNAAFVVDDAWVFRFPRRPESAPLLANEARVVPRLAPLLPMRIASPTWFASSVAGFPRPVAGYPHVPGETADRARLDDEARVALAEPLARVLRALHDADPSIDGPLPADAFGKSNPERVLAGIRANLDALALDRGRVLALAERLASAAPHAGAPRWVHGDFYPRHLVVDAGVLTGVIDWGDVHRGDPALDLSIVLGWLPARAEERFFAIYGDVDEATRARARFRALFYALVFLRHGAEADDRAFASLGRIYLERALA